MNIYDNHQWWMRTMIMRLMMMMTKTLFFFLSTESSHGNMVPRLGLVSLMPTRVFRHVWCPKKIWTSQTSTKEKALCPDLLKRWLMFQHAIKKRDGCWNVEMFFQFVWRKICPVPLTKMYVLTKSDEAWFWCDIWQSPLKKPGMFFFFLPHGIVNNVIWIYPLTGELPSTGTVGTFQVEYLHANLSTSPSILKALSRARVFPKPGPQQIICDREINLLRPPVTVSTDQCKPRWKTGVN